MTPQQNMNSYTPPVQPGVFEVPAYHTPPVAAPVEAVTASDLLSEEARAAVAEAQKHAEVGTDQEQERALKVIELIHSYGKNLLAVRLHERKKHGSVEGAQDGYDLPL